MKHILSLILTLCMLCTLLPAYPAQAAEAADDALTELIELGADGAELTVGLTAAKDCTLFAALYDRAGKMFFSTSADIGAESGKQGFDFPIDTGDRSCFTAKAFLLDSESSEPLCEHMEIEYAKWMQFDALTEIDPETVALDEDSDTYYRSDILNFFSKTGASIFDIADAIESVGGEVVGRVPLLDLLQVRVETGTLDALRAKADALNALSCIAYADVHTLIPHLPSAATPVAPDDPWGSLLNNDSDWLDDDVDSNNWWAEQVRAPYAWSYDDRFSDITVGIIDTSFDTGHEDLKNVVSFATPALAAANNSTPWWVDWTPTEKHAWNFAKQRRDQLNTHGTHVAGIIGAEANNGKGITGLAWNADLLLAPAGELDGYTIVEHLATLVENGAKVINISAGCCEGLSAEKPSFTNEEIRHAGKTTAVALAKLLERGYDFVVVQSAGNGRQDDVPVDAIQNGLIASITTETPTESETVSIADVLNRCLVVTATEVASNKCIDYVNYGKQVDIAAPGASIYSTIPGNVGTDFEFTGSYGPLSGTSMAAPMVTGVCAMVWSVSKDFTGADVCSIVTSSADAFAYSTADTTNYPMLNAQLAVETALQYKDGKIPLEINVQYADGLPATGVTIEGTGLETAPVTDKYGTAVCYVAPDRYLITANPAGWYDEQDVTVKRKTVVNLTLEETWFEWALDATGNHLTINGYGPMPDYTTTSAPWGKDIYSATVNGVATVGAYAFYNCRSLSKVTLSDSVRKINEAAFDQPYDDSALTQIALPDRLFEIGPRTFTNTSLTSLSIPGSVHTIGTYAFSSLPLTSLTLGNGIVRIGDNAFSVCESLQSVHIPPSVVEIGNSAFIWLANATSITLAKGNLKTIGENAFAGCYKITSFTVPDGVTKIPYGMLGSCLALETVNIPEGITSIDGSAFSQCNALKTLKLPSTLTELGSGVFYQCKALESITIPDGVTEIKYDAFKECPVLKSVTLPKNLIEIGDEAFYECTSLAAIQFPDTLERIGNYAFMDCTSLKSLTIPMKAEVSDCFTDCTGLETVTFKPGSVVMYHHAFSGCTSLKTVNLPEHFVGIDSDTFLGCTSLTHIDFPASMMYIGENAFADSGLKTATFAGSSADWAKVYNLSETLKAASITCTG